MTRRRDPPEVCVVREGCRTGGGFFSCRFRQEKTSARHDTPSAFNYHSQRGSCGHTHTVFSFTPVNFKSFISSCTKTVLSVSGWSSASLFLLRRCQLVTSHSDQPRKQITLELSKTEGPVALRLVGIFQIFCLVLSRRGAAFCSCPWVQLQLLLLLRSCEHAVDQLQCPCQTFCGHFKVSHPKTTR